MIDLKGTKEIIFDAAVQLISVKGFEVVNMREIAAMSDIKAASIYNHFSGKQEILDTVYAYYCRHFFDNQKPQADIKSVILTGTREEIIKAVSFTFEASDTKKYQRMILISKIIYMRIFEDAEARRIFFEIMSAAPEEYVQELMEYGILVGRFKPFDYVSYSRLLIGYRHNMAVRAFSGPDYSVGQLEEESKMDKLLCALLPLTSD